MKGRKSLIVAVTRGAIVRNVLHVGHFKTNRCFVLTFCVVQARQDLHSHKSFSADLQKNCDTRPSLFHNSPASRLADTAMFECRPRLYGTLAGPTSLCSQQVFKTSHTTSHVGTFPLHHFLNHQVTICTAKRVSHPPQNIS